MLLVYHKKCFLSIFALRQKARNNFFSSFSWTSCFFNFPPIYANPNFVKSETFAATMATLDIFNKFKVVNYFLDFLARV